HRGPGRVHVQIAPGLAGAHRLVARQKATGARLQLHERAVVDERRGRLLGGEPLVEADGEVGGSRGDGEGLVEDVGRVVVAAQPRRVRPTRQWTQRGGQL